MLYYFETLFPHEKPNYEFWWRIRRNFEALPEIQSYYNRPDAAGDVFMPPPPMTAWRPQHKVVHGYWDFRGRGQASRPG